MPVPVETPWVEMGEGGVEARLGTPNVVGGKDEFVDGLWVEGRDIVSWGVSVGESLLIMRKRVIGIGDGVGVLTVMGNEGRGKGGMMEGWGIELEGDAHSCCYLFNRECVWGREEENGDSLVREVLLFMSLLVLSLRICYYDQS